LLGRTRRIADAAGVSVAALRELRQPEGFVAVTVGDRDLDRQLVCGRLRGAGESQETRAGFPALCGKAAAMSGSSFSTRTTSSRLALSMKVPPA